MKQNDIVTYDIVSKYIFFFIIKYDMTLYHVIIFILSHNTISLHKIMEYHMIQITSHNTSQLCNI